MIEIRPFGEADWPAVQEIYQQGINTKNATFQEKVKAWTEWNGNTLQACRLVATAGEKVVGWAALSPVSSRAVYAGVAEVSVYVSTTFHGQGIGRMLQAGIFPENIASLKLHQNCGFRVVGVREKLGKMGDTWRDVLLLERRSKIVGI